MLDILEDLTLTVLASEAETYDQFDLGDDKKIEVKAFKDDQQVRHFFMGKTAPFYRHTFVRLAR